MYRFIRQSRSSLQKNKTEFFWESEPVLVLGRHTLLLQGAPLTRCWTAHPRLARLQSSLNWSLKEACKEIHEFYIAPGKTTLTSPQGNAYVEKNKTRGP